MWGPRPNPAWMPATELIPGKLWLGSTLDAQDDKALKALGIKARVNVRTTGLSPIEGIETYWRPLIDWYGNEPSQFLDAVDTVSDLIKWGTPTLLHCHKGISRSVSVAAAWMARKDSITFDDAIAKIKALRYFVCPFEGVRDIARFCLGEIPQIPNEPDW